ncbi:hypothetical protein ACFL4L_06955, partial [bacterium]
MDFKKVFLILVVFINSAFLFGSQSEKHKNQSRQISKAQIDEEIGTFDGNRIFTYMKNNGQFVYQKDGDSGMFWPGRESNKTICYEAGFWVAGMVNGDIRTACADFESEWTAGKILPNGEPDDPENPRYRLYKINRGDLINPEVNPDFLEWPVEDGAPWIDQDGDGLYEPLEGDRPDLLGDQMVWYVMNDLESTKHKDVLGSAPLGLECRVTIWGYNRPDEVGDMMFCKFQLFNKMENVIDSCYVGIRADTDLGGVGDEFIGCDTTLNLGFCYNDGPDGVYGEACPALGFNLFQGAIVSSKGDTARGFGQVFQDYKNLGMSVLSKIINNDDDYPDPETPLECWNLMSGLRFNGEPFINPITNKPVVPVLYAPGDPVSGTGWLWAMDHPPGNIRLLQTSGPFTMAPGDSQEVIVACIIARGSNALNSVTRLKQVSTIAQGAYNYNFDYQSAPP